LNGCVPKTFGAEERAGWAFSSSSCALVVIGTVSGVITGGLKLEREKVKAKSRGYGEETDQLRGVVGEMHKPISPS
jgi:hypothetical protein